MVARRRFSLVLVAIACVAAAWPGTGPSGARARATDSLPARLTDQEFWRLIRDSSEPGGYFRSENLVSNEQTFQYVIPALTKTVRPGGVYLGVAPDQNFTYIAAIEPQLAFIVDIRRGNLLEHLMYKALLELSADRAEFISRLFSKRRPAGVGPNSTVDDLFAAFDQVATSDVLYGENVRAIEDLLVKRHGFTLSVEDLQGLENVYFAFFWDGPSIRYTSTPSGFPGRGRGGFGRFGPPSFPSYEDLMRQTDWNGQSRGYLASEARFRFLKDFEAKNLLVPLVGDFAGPKALRAAGQYARDHDAIVTAFYVSNVEQYLFQDGLWENFAENVATLPVDATSTFIRSVSGRFGYLGPYQWADGRASALDPIRAFVKDFRAGRIRSYSDVNARSR